jgi:hypothetical protein
VRIFRFPLAETAFRSLRFAVVALVPGGLAYRLEVGSPRDRRDAILYRGHERAVATLSTVDGAVTDEMQGRFKGSTCSFVPSRGYGWYCAEGGCGPMDVTLPEIAVIEAILAFVRDQGLCGQ